MKINYYSSLLLGFNQLILIKTINVSGSDGGTMQN